MGRDSFLGTILVALVLCVACSVLVSGAAYLLHDRQEANKLRYEKENILKAAGLIRPKNAEPSEYDSEALVAGDFSNNDLNTLFENRVNKVLVNLDDGSIVDPDEVSYDEYDPKEAVNNPKQSKEIEPEVGPTPGVDRRPNYQFVYEVTAKGNKEKIDKFVLPVYGKGLWSTLYGFLAIDADGETIRGITFYEHGETPGLGGEVENPKWQAQWDGKLAYDDGGEVIVQVVKGTANADNKDYTIDGLSGATITTKGVSNFVEYWLGKDGFKPFLEKHAKS